MTNLTSLLGLAVFLSVSSANAATEVNPKCKASYSPTEQRMNFQNFDLGQKGEYNYKTDCSDLFVKIMKKVRLPKVGGKTVTAHLVYELPQDDLFPMLNKLLKPHKEGTMRLEIRFSLPGVMSHLSPDMTSIDVLLMPMP